MTIPTMLSIPETMKKTGLSYEFIRGLCRQERIVYMRTGKKYLINLEKFIEYLNGEDAAGEGQ